MLVFALGLVSASPELHAWVHGAESGHGHESRLPLDAEHNCVVAWFAHGVALTVDTAQVAVAPQSWREAPAPVVDELLLSTPHYWHQPGRGPPTV